MLSLQATDSILNGLKSIDIHANNVDELVKHGITHILDKGDRVSTRAGDALQAYDVNYLLLDSRDRVHTARPQAVKYFARELCAYFQGSLKVDGGLSKASKFWNHLADQNGNINSNYGYYVFYQPVPDVKISSQYDWVIKRLCDNRDSRRAIININQGMHKTATKDFPCTVAINYFIREGFLCSKVFSRSTDVITGLPYDMGFFSFLTELVYQDLVDRGVPDLKLGYTMMASNFTQIYDRHADKALDISDSFVLQESVMMPRITNASEVLEDIYNGTSNSEVMKWVHENAT